MLYVPVNNFQSCWDIFFVDEPAVLKQVEMSRLRTQQSASSESGPSTLQSEV